MSGGSFNYAYHHVSSFVYELKNKLDAQQHGEAEKMPDTVLKMLSRISVVAELSSDLMREVEYLFSHDTSEGTFMRRVEKIMDEFSDKTEQMEFDDDA